MQVEKSGKAELRLTHLYLGLWKTLFEAVWEQRNEMLHGKNGIVDVVLRIYFSRKKSICFLFITASWMCFVYLLVTH